MQNAQNYPEYAATHKQEAARVLDSDFDTDGEIIRGMTDLDRLNAWTEVAKDLDAKTVRRQLRLRRQALTNRDVDVEFEPASEIDSPSVEAASEPAVADGGAVVEDESEAASESSIDDNDDEQTVMEYADAAHRESKYQDALSIARTYTEPSEIQDKLQEEWRRNERRPHIVDALEDRLSEVAA